MSQALRKYSTQMSKNSQSRYVQKPMPAEIQAIFMWYLEQMLCMVPTHFNITFYSSSHRDAHCRKFLISLKSPDTYSLLTAVIPLSHWSTPKSLGVTMACWLGLLILFNVHWESDPGAEKTRWCPITHKPHRWWRGTCLRSPGKSFTRKQWSAAPVSLLGKTTGPKNWSSKMPTPRHQWKLICWCFDATVVWGLSSTQTRLLWSSQYCPLWIPAHQ
jgi:hypothetical protein